MTTEELITLIRKLVEVCKGNNKQIQSDISLISQLDKECFELLEAHEKLEAMRRYNATLLRNEEIHNRDTKELMESAALMTIKYNVTLKERIEEQRMIVKDAEEKKA